MASLTDLGDIAAQLTTSGRAEHLFSFIDSRVGASAAVATVAARFTSLWQYNKTTGGGGAAPGAVAAPDNTTTGGLLQTDPSGGREKWLLGMNATILGNSGTLILYDRLLHISGLSGTSTSAQTVSGSLTRNTGGFGNQIWVEIYTQIGTTATTITASYTNQSGTSGRTTKATSIGGTGLREAQRMIPLPLQDGDTGVQAVASVTLAASTTTAGDFGVVVARPLLVLPISPVSTGSTRDCIAGFPSINEIDTDACLALSFLANSTAAPQVYVQLSTVEK